jgi:enoyl-CoA hydratase/carnithine racemase
MSVEIETIPGGITRLTLRRPERRNALSLELMRQLLAALQALTAETRVVVLAAEGSVFSAGHDLREMPGNHIAGYRELFDTCSQLMERLQSIPQPVIAEVQGLATAAGCQLVATCDLAIAADSAQFATPGVKIGLFCTTPMVALTRAIGRKRAMEMLLTGRPIDAATAADWGLINRAVPAKLLRTTVLDLATEIAASSTLTIGLGKQAFYTQIDLDQPKAYAYAKEVMSMNALAADAQEGITAFLEKRPACWTGC